MRMAKANRNHMGKAVNGSEDRMQKEHQGAKTLSAHTVERTMCRARHVLAFSDEWGLSGRANRVSALVEPIRL